MEGINMIIAFGIGMIVLCVCFIGYIIVKSDSYKQVDDIRMRDLLADLRECPEGDRIRRKEILKEIECLASKTQSS